MDRESFSAIISDQTQRALWEVGNIIACVPDSLWNKTYSGMPVWKHIYHMLHSLDLWFVGPQDARFEEPSFHKADLNNLNTVSDVRLTRDEIASYFVQIQRKITDYLAGLRDKDLLVAPDACEYTRFTLIMAQHRHLHTHMGMIMGFIVSETGLWPKVVGLEGTIPHHQTGIYDEAELR